MKAVKFLMPFTVGALYNEGEVAGFEDAVANDLIERKIAEPVKAAKAKADDPVDPATLDDAALDKLIAAEKVKVADGADRAAKIEAVLAARKK
jgi:hypothetical protein